jgi:hypothetical protein
MMGARGIYVRTAEGRSGFCLEEGEGLSIREGEGGWNVHVGSSSGALYPGWYDMTRSFRNPTILDFSPCGIGRTASSEALVAGGN